MMLLTNWLVWMQCGSARLLPDKEEGELEGTYSEIFLMVVGHVLEFHTGF